RARPRLGGARAGHGGGPGCGLPGPAAPLPARDAAGAAQAPPPRDGRPEAARPIADRDAQARGGTPPRPRCARRHAGPARAASRLGPAVTLRHGEGARIPEGKLATRPRGRTLASNTPTERPMKAYAMAHLRDVDFNDEIADYLRRIDATLEPFGGRFLVHGGRVHPLEGEFDAALVVLEFPTLDAARDWYR